MFGTSDRKIVDSIKERKEAKNFLLHCSLSNTPLKDHNFHFNCYIDTSVSCFFFSCFSCHKLFFLLSGGQLLNIMTCLYFQFHIERRIDTYKCLLSLSIAMAVINIILIIRDFIISKWIYLSPISQDKELYEFS